MNENQGTGADRMEFQRENLWVGLFVLIALLVFASLSALAVHKRFFRREYTLHTSLPRIEGLQPGADVRMRGHVVGLVRKIALTTSPEIRFEVEVGIFEAVRLPVGTRVRLTGGFGSTLLDLITPGDTADPDSPPALPPDKQLLFLEPESSVPGFVGASLDTLFADATSMIGQLSKTLAGADTMINGRLGPQMEKTIETLTGDLVRVIGQMEATMAEGRETLALAGDLMEENRPRVAQLLDAANRDMESVERLTGRLNGLMADLDTRLGPLLDDVGSGMKKADSVLGKMDAAMDEEKIRTIIENLLTASADAEILVAELRKRPWRLFRRVKGEKQELLEELEAQRAAEALLESPESP